PDRWSAGAHRRQPGQLSGKHLPCKATVWQQPEDLAASPSQNISHSRKCCSTFNSSARHVPSRPNSTNFRSTSTFSRRPFGILDSAPRKFLRRCVYKSRRNRRKRSTSPTWVRFLTLGRTQTMAEATRGLGQNTSGGTRRRTASTSAKLWTSTASAP